MLNLEEARKIQKERQRKALLAFAGWAALIAACTVLTALFTDYFSRIAGLWVLPLLLLALAGRLTRVYRLLAPKEFSGTITDCHVYVEHTKTNASHLPGSTYDAVDVTKMDITVKNAAGNEKSKTFVCNSKNVSLKTGDAVTLLRFIDQPIRV